MAVAETRVHKKLWIITLVLYGVALLLFAFNGNYSWTGKLDDVTNSYDKVLEFMPSIAGAIFAVFGV
ncbi:MAG: hypothetical protein K2N29_03365, partial [Ruminiclostridium sp.]|nr:hypothetical protein [Ruminiclostridium sp.]